MILEILGTTAFGTISGGILGYFTRKQEGKNLKAMQEHEANMVTVKANASVMLAKAKSDGALIKGELDVEKLEAKAFANSQLSGNKFSEILKDLIRPAILTVLMFMSYEILVALDQLVGGISGLPKEDVIALYKAVVLNVLALTGTATGWYFSARTSKQFDRLLSSNYKGKENV